MSKRKKKSLALLALVVFSGCATMPTGPSVLVLPAPSKPIEQFQTEDMVCRQWAEQQIGMSSQDTVNQSTFSGAVVGTAIGTGVGALLGAASGNMGSGAVLGAGSGLLFGTAAGAGAGEASGYEAQRRYDNAYVQCMYAKGNQIPGQVNQYRIRRSSPAPPTRSSVPPDYDPDYSPMR